VQQQPCSLFQSCIALFGTRTHPGSLCATQSDVMIACQDFCCTPGKNTQPSRLHTMRRGSSCAETIIAIITTIRHVGNCFCMLLNLEAVAASAGARGMAYTKSDGN